MTRHEPGSRAVVLVIDLPTGMFDGALFVPIHGANALVDRARSLIDWARRTKRPVAFIRHDGEVGDALAPGAPGWAIWSALGQADDEPTFSKSVGNAFATPELRAWLKSCASDEVILLGAQTDQCVDASVAGALELGLKVTVVSDAHSTWDSENESAAEIIARYNQIFGQSGAVLETTQHLTA